MEQLRSTCVTIMTTDMFLVVITIHSFPHRIYHRVCNKSITTGATCETQTAYPTGARFVDRCLPFFFILFSVLRLTAFGYLFGIFKRFFILETGGGGNNKRFISIYAITSTMCVYIKNIIVVRIGGRVMALNVTFPNI